MNHTGMLVIVDYRAQRIIERMFFLGYHVIPFSGKGLVYSAIEGHPDIFIFNGEKRWILSPNTPPRIIQFFVQQNIPFRIGFEPVGNTYPETVKYNVFMDEEVCIIHPYVDRIFQEIIHGQEVVFVSQGYVRCNVFRIGKEFITSDVQIHQSLLRHGFLSHYVFPVSIRLPGKRHGFIGGCLSRHGSKIYFTGDSSFEYYPLLQKLCNVYGLELVSLGQGNPVDVGGMIFI